MQVIDQLAGPVMLPVRLARTLMPEQTELPVYVAAAALAVTGVVEWPVAATIGIGYVALRRWSPRQLIAGDGPQNDDDLVAAPVDAGDDTEERQMPEQPTGQTSDQSRSS